MGKKFYKIRDPITGWWHSPKDFDKPVPLLPLAKVMTSNGDKGIHSVGIVNDPSELALEFGSAGGHKIPGLFENVRARFKEAIAGYVARGWLTEADLAELGLQKMETKLDGFKFPTRLTEHTVKRKVERTREKFEL
ncbi:hypothetical protein ES705_22927 [subsurface metagenome]|jgi:hypothetical protein